MPNYVTNILTFQGSEQRIEQLIQHIKGEKDGQYIDFNKIIPMPDELEGTSSPVKILSQTDYELQEARIKSGEVNEFEKYFGLSRGITQEMSDDFETRFGANNWYDWKIENWGCKWNAGDQSYVGGVLTFTTAWSIADNVMEALSKTFFDVVITLKYADEDFGQNCGVIEYQNGYATRKRGKSYELANEVLESIDGSNAIENFSDCDENELDNDYVTFVVKVMFEDFQEPSIDKIKELSNKHIDCLLKHLKQLNKEEFKPYEQKLHEILDNSLSFFSLEHDINVTE